MEHTAERFVRDGRMMIARNSGRRRIGTSFLHACFGLALLAGFSTDSFAQDVAADRTANSLWTRPALLDGPGSPKEALRQRGINLDLWWTQFYQGLARGDGNKDWQYGGKDDIIATFDMSRIFGLWSGLSVNVHQELLYGEDANAQGDGTLFPINTAMGFPRLGGFDQDTSIVITQRFGDCATLSFGKFNMLDPASRRPLVGGGGLDTFQHIGVAAPISGVTPPYLLGASLSLPTKPVSFSLMIYDPRNAQDFDVIKNPFEDGVTFSLTGTLPTKAGDLDGSHSLRGVYSTQEGVNLKDIPQLVLPPELRDDVGTKQGYWYVSYSFHQNLWQDSKDPKKAWGLFGEAALSDGNPNPVLGHWYLGVGGNSFLAGRDKDLWGVVYFDYRWSRDLRRAAITSAWVKNHYQWTPGDHLDRYVEALKRAGAE
jgi:porin